MTLLLDPLFRTPLLVGLLCGGLLPIAGTYLRLRDEWLAALGVAHLTAASSLIGMALGLAPLTAGIGGAALAVGLKRLLASEGNLGYVLMILGGWSLLYLTAANSSLGESLTHALTDGQLYFANMTQLLSLAATGALFLLALRWWSPRLLRARFFPQFESANRLPAWRWHLSFDLVVALLLALATGCIGLMAAFALAFLPAWISFRTAPNWKANLLVSAGTGVASYLCAFVVALEYDQPFGPVLVAVLLGACAAAELIRRLSR